MIYLLKNLKIETAWQQLMYNIYKEEVKVNQQEIDKQVLKYIKNNSQITEFKISEIEISLNENKNYLNEVKFIKKKYKKMDLRIQHLNLVIFICKKLWGFRLD